MIDNHKLTTHRLPDHPRDLTTAVKDYRTWIADHSKPMVGPDYENLRQRIISNAMALVFSGKLVDIEG